MITFEYTNHRGDKSTRRITPAGIRFGASEYYPEPTWLINGWCHDRGAWREFNMRNMYRVTGDSVGLPMEIR